MTARTVEFGLFLIPEADRYPDLLRQVRYADDAGLDLIGIQDHPYQRRFADTWTLISALAVQTTRLRFFPDVANLPLRNPAVLAKAAATLDLITGGRVELGLGAGAFWEAIEAMGAPRLTKGQAVQALEEAIAVLRAMWSGERSVTAGGQFHAVAGVHPGPAPAHDIGIWLGSGGPKSLALTGRSADGWVPSSSYFPPARLAEAGRIIDDAAAEAGRDPAAVRRVYNLSGSIGTGSEFLNGPVERWVDDLTTLHREHRVDGFVFWPSEGDIDVQVHQFAEEVVPQVRSALG